MYLRCVGGEVGATSSLAPKIGPLGLVSHKNININFDTVNKKKKKEKCLKFCSHNQILFHSRPKKLVTISPKLPVIGRA